MKKILAILVVLLTAIVLVSCNQADNVKYNLRKEADAFSVYRKVTVINLRSDKILIEVEGYVSIKSDEDGDLNIIIQVAPNEYKMHYVGLANEVVYISEQLENTHTDPYHFKIIIFAVRPVIEVG